MAYAVYCRGGKHEVMRPGTKSNQTPGGMRAVWNRDQSVVRRAHAALGEVLSKVNSCLDASLRELSSTAVPVVWLRTGWPYYRSFYSALSIHDLACK